MSRAAIDEARAESSCSMGVGCGTSGVCWAVAHGTPEMCPRGTALDLIAAERRRQVEELGFSAERDDSYVRGELGSAGGAYALAERARQTGFTIAHHRENFARFYEWPWHAYSFDPATAYTPASRIRELTKAGALIVAEIERLQRLQAKAGEA